MPNATQINGTPIQEMVKGFDRPDFLYCCCDATGHAFFIGYKHQCKNLIQWPFYLYRFDHVECVPVGLSLGFYNNTKPVK